MALPAQARDEDDINWNLCPITDTLPAFTDAPPLTSATDDSRAAIDSTDPTATPDSTTAAATDAAPPPGPATTEGTTTAEGTPATADATPAPSTAPEDRKKQDTLLLGDKADSENENTIVQGNVSLSRGDQYLGTDKLTYNQETGQYVAEGNVRYQDSGMRVVAERATGNQDADTHRIEEVQYQLTRRRGNGGAEAIEMAGAKGTLIGSTYSTCDPGQRVWELRAGRIDIDTEEGMGVARNATLRIGKVPVLHVPWFMFPIDDRRRTGLLYPSISLSGRNGFDWRQPVYINLAPNYDATLNPRYMSERGGSLGGEFRWLNPNGRGELRGHYMPHDKLPGDEPDRYRGDLPEDDRGSLRFSALQRFGNWYTRADLGWVSDTHYFEDFSNSLYGISAYDVMSTAGLYGRGRWWEAGLVAEHHQLADYTLTERNLPFDRLPRGFFSYAQTFNNFFELGVDAEAVRFQHEDIDPFVGNDYSVPGGSRFDFKPFVSLPLEGASWFFKPKLAWRYTTYQLDGTPQDRALEFARRYARPLDDATLRGLARRFADDSPSRSLPIGSVDAGLFFDRETRIRGDNYIHTLEPRLYYLNVPYRNQDAIPAFDSDALTFSWGQLFRDNRYTGADRQTDANQITLALTTRLIGESDGRERLSASLGQIKYLEDSRVVLPNERSVVRGKSAWVAEATLAPSDRWNISAAYQWDPQYRGTDLASLRARYLIGEAGIVNLGYRYRRRSATQTVLLEQADFSFLYPINPTWSVVGRYYHSIKDDEPLEALAGVQWESCCLAVRTLFRRYLRNRTGELNDSFQVEFELKGLGSAGQDTRRILRRAILGYDRDDLYLVPPSSVDFTDSDTVPDPTP